MPTAKNISQIDPVKSTAQPAFDPPPMPSKDPFPQRNAPGIWEWDLATRRSTWSPRTLEIYGLIQHDGTIESWLQQLHPADRPSVKAAFDSLLNGASYYTLTFRHIQPNGTISLIESTGIAQRDPDGRLRRVIGTDRDITAEKAREDAQAVSEQRWQLAIEGANEAVWDWDFTTGVIYHDEHWAGMLGYEAGEIEASFEGWRWLVHPDDLANCELLTNEHFAGHSPRYQAEYRMRTKSGDWHWILDRGKVVNRTVEGRPLRMVGTHTDITVRKDLEQRLHRSDELADQVSRLARIGGWEVDLKTKRVTWTSEMHRIHEVNEDYQPTLDDIRWLFPAGFIESFDQTDPVVRVDMFDRELPLVTVKGRNIWVRVLGRTEIHDGHPTRVHGALQDITAQHASESDRRTLELQLFQAQKMETLGTLSGGIAHDFNNLLTGILGYHELAADSIPDDHPARACLAEARNASLRARELVEQILTFSRQSSKAEHGAMDLTSVVEEARRFLRATLPANITIEATIDPNCRSVLADGTQIHQVILNLGSNASHAMRSHGGTLRLNLQPWEIDNDQALRLSDLRPGHYVRLSMSDTGHGMDDATRRRIFEPFFTTKNTQEGTGLGLAVVHSIVKTHRGAIVVESVIGLGTTFHVYLPTGTSESTGEIWEENPTPHGAGELICIVDDEEVVGSYTEAALEKLGYRAIVYGSAEECLAAWPGKLPTCSLLITDQAMPGLQGTKLAVVMRKLIPALPVILMSGYFSKIPSQELDELEPVTLLAKP
ncbi:MAG: PAS domain-containing protein, partial [Opitutaceae bacterium]